jgi:Leucine-rich repeat (LRR) protein
MSTKLNDLTFLEGMDLEYFFYYGSKIKDFSYIKNIKSLKTIYLKSNATLKDICFIENLGNLEKVILMYLSKITFFPKTENLKKLKKVIVQNCNKLENIDELKNLNNVVIGVYGKLVRYQVK